MSAPTGNQFWKARSSHGRNPIFATPDDLWSAAAEYFEWVEANPLYEAKAFSYEGEVTISDLPKMRAMTIAGLCIFLDISQQTWADYRSRQDFFGVVSRVDAIIRDQKFAGAAAGLLNPNIIARDLGLADKTEVTGKDGSPIEVEAKPPREVAKMLLALIQRAHREEGVPAPLENSQILERKSND